MNVVLRSRMRLGVGIAALALAAVLAAVQPTRTSAAPGDNAVVHWSGVAEAAIAAGRPPASSTVLAGMVQAAMYDAVAAVDGGLEPFATGVTAPPGASADAAGAQAARDVLVARVPGLAGTVQAAYDAYMASIADGPAKDAGKAVGAVAAGGMLAMRTGDHFDDAVAYVQAAPGPGVFEPIAASTPVDVKLGKVRPFTYESQSAYRPDAPYELTSKRYAQDVAEVQALGRVNSTVRTPAQTETVRFFTDQTFVQYSRALRLLANARSLDLRESARLLAYTWVAAADTMIACWEAKYHYGLWRPNHAIQRADTDGNAATHPDPDWTPLRVTAPSPEYPSGHACFTTAVMTALGSYFGRDHLRFSAYSPASGTTRHYDSLQAATAELMEARIWAGVHYRFASEHGHRLGLAVTHDVLNRAFQRR